MRKHRRFERVSNKVITVQCSALTPRELMNMMSADIVPEIKARAGTYGNGSEDYPIPRTMNIARLASMASRPAPAPVPAPPPAPAPAPAPDPAPAE